MSDSFRESTCCTPFQKKSKSGVETPKAGIELVERRLKSLLNRHRADHRGQLMARKKRRRGIDNVLSDLGFPDAEELTAKTLPGKKLNDITRAAV